MIELMKASEVELLWPREGLPPRSDDLTLEVGGKGKGARPGREHRHPCFYFWCLPKTLLRHCLWVLRNPLREERSEDGSEAGDKSKFTLLCIFFRCLGKRSLDFMLY